jgi:LPXTG-motif cell wall-anchored protein
MTTNFPPEIHTDFVFVNPLFLLAIAAMGVVALGTLAFFLLKKRK